MKTKISVVALILALIISLGTFEVKAEQIVITNNSKISAELEAKIEQVDDEELIDAYVWLSDIDHAEVEREVSLTTGISEQSLVDDFVKSLNVNNICNCNSDSKDIDFSSMTELSNYLEVTQGKQSALSEKADDYYLTKREVSRKLYVSKNAAFIAERLDDTAVIYQSQYAPMVICRLTKSQINSICQDVRVEELSLYTNCLVDDFGDLDVSLPTISADKTKAQGILGRYVRIGQIETARPNVNASALEGKNIIVRGSGNSDHASLVAAIMVGNGGVAPSATLYSTSAYYNASTNSDNTSYETAIEYENIEWLVSQGVSVINRSFGGTSSTYDTFSKWIDHIVSQHNVTFVQAAGNGGENSYVAIQSYNAIVVGGINDMGTSSVADDTYYNYTSSKYTVCNKPDLVAPAVGFSMEEAFGGLAKSGTSFAAPHVTGVVAQMMCTVTALKFRPDAIKAAILASCDRKTIPGSSLSELSDKEGAGVINALKAVNALSRTLSQESYYTSTESTISFDFYPKTIGMKAVVISWLKNVTCNEDDNDAITTSALTNFDLYIYDSQGNEQFHSCSGINNVESIRFNVTSTQKYVVKIVRNNNYNITERISLSCDR